MYDDRPPKFSDIHKTDKWSLKVHTAGMVMPLKVR